MNKIKYWLRWISVFPGAIIASLLATFFLHWILYFTLVNGGTISGVNIKPIEYMLYPFVIAITFIFAGYKIAPKYKFKTAIVLFGIYLIVWSTVSVISLFKGSIYGIDMQFSGRTILSLLGAIIGLYTVKKVNEEKTITNSN
ncbi:MAG: hypothetical protein KAQ64_02480 [Candidatus Pacebacteria bacterium]|nr:hypothetical protein [Candidatus Paceibacterota bacterium]